MRAELDIMIRKTASGCSLQVVELITVLKYSMSTDLLFNRDSRPVCAKLIRNTFSAFFNLVFELFSAVESETSEI